MADFAAEFSGLAEDIPHLQRETFLHEDGQVPSPVMLYKKVLSSATERHHQTAFSASCSHRRMPINKAFPRSRQV